LSPEQAALARVVRSLEARGIPCMVTGSVASSHHGRPGMTHDVDVVVDPEPESLARLVEDLQASGFYVDGQVAREPLRRRRQFNAIGTESAQKVDLIVRKERLFSREELRRRQPAEIPGGIRVQLATAEDTILAKLEWAKKAGGSEKQLADVAGILDVRGEGLDRVYVERWARSACWSVGAG